MLNITTKLLINLVLIILFENFSFGQINSQNPLDNQYTPPSNCVLGSSQTLANRPSSSSECNSNAIRFNASSLVRSNLMFMYEKKLAENLSVTGSFGISTGFDNVLLFLLEDDAILQNHSETIDYYLLMSESRFKNGYLGQLSIRIYRDIDYDFLRYFDFCFASSRRNIEFPEFGPNQPIIAESDKIVVNSLYGTIGNQWNVGTGKVKFSHEFSVGFGVKTINTKFYEETYKYNGSSEEFYAYTTNGERLTKLYPYFSFTYCFGIGW
ncbi:MAG: hypothetical protein WCK02_09440 [Bacteroidota bacterium]